MLLKNNSIYVIFWGMIPILFCEKTTFWLYSIIIFCYILTMFFELFDLHIDFHQASYQCNIILPKRITAPWRIICKQFWVHILYR